MATNKYALSTLTKVAEAAPVYYNLVTKPVKIAASQTILKGDLLQYDASGLGAQALALDGSDGGLTTSGGNQDLVGMALEDITTNASGVDEDNGNKDTIIVALWVPANKFLLRAYNSTATNCQVQDFVRGTAYNVGRYRTTSTNWQYVLTTGTTNPEASVSEHYPGQSATDTYALVWVRPVFSSAQVVG